MSKVRLFLIVVVILTGGSVWAGAPAHGQVTNAQPANIPGNENRGDVPPIAQPTVTPPLRRSPTTTAPVRTEPEVRLPDFRPAADEQAVRDAIEWLNRVDLQSGRGKRALRLIPVPGDGALFVLDRQRAKPGPGFRYHLLTFTEPLTVDKLKVNILQNLDKTFVGIYRIDEQSYLMVFYGKQ